MKLAPVKQTRPQQSAAFVALFSYNCHIGNLDKVGSICLYFISHQNKIIDHSFFDLKSIFFLKNSIIITSQHN